MSRLLFTPLAESDLNQILDYIAVDRPLTAVEVLPPPADDGHFGSRCRPPGAGV